MDSQNLEFWCGCKNSTMRDNGEGQTGCQNCGIILYETNVDTENVIINQTQDNVHQSTADYSEENHGLGGSITTKEIKKIMWRDSKKDKKFVDYRITKLASNDEIKRNIVYQEIKNICKKERHSKRINTDACYDYEKNIEKYGFQKFKNNKMLAGTCVLRVCKYSKVKINISKVSKIINEPREKLVKCYNDIHKKIHMERLNDVENFELDRRGVIGLEISRMAGVLEIPEMLIRRNLGILNNEKFELIMSGSEDTSIAAGIICIVCNKNDLEITPKKIAKKCGVSENTVRNQAKNIAKLLEIVLLDKRRRNYD